MKKTVVFIILVLSILMPLTAGFAGAEESMAQAEGNRSPTTGLETDRPYRPLMVIISNAYQARPPWNLSEADIVYEAIYWGPGHTRYVCIYNDAHPAKVGSIRSARAYHIYLRAEWDCPIVHASRELDVFQAYETHRVDNRFIFSTISTGPHSAAITRTKERMSPHNAVVNLARLAEECWPLSSADATRPYAARRPLFQFSETPTMGDQAAKAIEIYFEGIGKKEPNYLAGYTYNPETHAYDRSYCGYAQVDAESGKRIVAHNIIVQFCPLTYLDDDISQPQIDLFGEGRIDVYIDGTRIQGTWKRDSGGGQTQFYDADGNVLLLRPGKTFIQIVPTTYGFDYDEETMLCRYAADIPLPAEAQSLQ